MGPRGLGSCGVVVIWSRQGEPRPKKRKNAVTAEQLAALVASLKVYTAEQVDRAAFPDTALFATPRYPDSLFTHAVAGAVLAEFVVDTTGRVEAETFGVVLSSHPLFSESVRHAVTDAAFTPASLNGKRVRQLVQLPFKFVPDSTVLRRGSR
jgi:outer membrane biosynthesis protein TonB